MLIFHHILDLPATHVSHKYFTITLCWDSRMLCTRHVSCTLIENSFTYDFCLCFTSFYVDYVRFFQFCNTEQFCKPSFLFILWTNFYEFCQLYGFCSIIHTIYIIMQFSPFIFYVFVECRISFTYCNTFLVTMSNRIKCNESTSKKIFTSSIFLFRTTMKQHQNIIFIQEIL